MRLLENTRVRVFIIVAGAVFHNQPKIGQIEMMMMGYALTTMTRNGKRVKIGVRMCQQIIFSVMRSNQTNKSNKSNKSVLFGHQYELFDCSNSQKLNG